MTFRVNCSIAMTRAKVMDSLLTLVGGKGHDLKAFHERFGTSSQSDLVLQDTPRVIEGIQDCSIGEKIMKKSHDFFDSQPVKGKPAKIYHTKCRLIFYRCENILLTLYFAQLVGKGLPQDPQAFLRCHVTRLLQTDHPRSCLAKCRSIGKAS
jgi:hypothetical protein